MVRWDLAFTPEVSGHGKGHWGCCEGISQYRRREREYLYKKKVEWTQARDRVMGEREEKRKKEGGLVSVRRGMCKGGKVERGWGGENTQGSEEGHTHKKKHFYCRH